MKRKIILIIAVLLFCSGLYIVAKGMQSRSISENQTQKEENLTASEKNDNNKKEVAEKNQQEKSSGDSKSVEKPDSTNTSTVKKEEKKVQEETSKSPNVKIVDTVNNKTILSAYIDLENKSVGEATIKILDSRGISYRAKGTGDTIYFSSIAGLTERKAGPESGWCYFINGKKYSIGAGSYTLKKGDTIEWRYLKDGISR